MSQDEIQKQDVSAEVAEFTNFEELARKLLSVPKTEIAAQRDEASRDDKSDE